MASNGGYDVLICLHSICTAQ